MRYKACHHNKNYTLSNTKDSQLSSCATHRYAHLQLGFQCVQTSLSSTIHIMEATRSFLLLKTVRLDARICHVGLDEAAVVVEFVCTPERWQMPDYSSSPKKSSKRQLDFPPFAEDARDTWPRLARSRRSAACVRTAIQRPYALPY